MRQFAMGNTIENSVDNRIKCYIETYYNKCYIFLDIKCPFVDVDIRVYGAMDNIMNAVRTLAATKISYIANALNVNNNYIFACIYECVDTANRKLNRV